MCVPTPIAPSATIVFQWARITGQSRRTWGHANGARIRIANSQRKNVIAIGGMSECSATADDPVGCPEQRRERQQQVGRSAGLGRRRRGHGTSIRIPASPPRAKSRVCSPYNCVLERSRHATFARPVAAAPRRTPRCPSLHPGDSRRRPQVGRRTVRGLVGCAGARAARARVRQCQTPGRRRHRRPALRATPERGNSVVCAGLARRAVPGLGNAALRPLLAAPGPGVRAAGNALPRVARRMRRDRGCGNDGAVPAGAAVISGGVHVLPAAGRATRRRTRCARSWRWPAMRT